MDRLLIAAIMASVAVLIVISGCAPTQQQTAQSPQQPAQPSQQEATQAEPIQTAPAPIQQQMPQPTAQQPAAAEANDLYNDNLDQALDELSQVE